MLSNNEKIDFLNLKLDFYKSRLEESLGYVESLEAIGDSIKIEMNQKDIEEYGIYISVIENEIISLTNEG